MSIETYTAGPSRGESKVAQLIQWAEGAHAAQQLAEGLCRTPFCPKAFQGNPVAAAAAMLAGAEVGLSPLNALKAFDVIEGIAAPRAITLRAIVQGAGHEIEVTESSEHRCVVRGRRRGSEAWQESVWTIQRAQRLKLTGKSNWQNQPQAMLLARATTEIARMIASDAILGIAFTAEELIDEATASTSTTPVRTVQRGTASASRMLATSKATRVHSVPAIESAPTIPADDLPPLPEDTEELTVVADTIPAGETGEMITDAQMRKLGAVFTELGIKGPGERADRLTLSSVIVDRHLESSKELTKLEASALIDHLISMAPDEALEVLGRGPLAPEAEIIEDTQEDLLAEGYDPTIDGGFSA